MIFAFSVLNVILGILFIWFYFFMWKSMSHVAAAFGIVFKVIAIILEILALLALIALFSVGSSIQDDPATEFDESELGTATSGLTIFMSIFVAAVLIYDVVFLVFIVKGFKAWKNDNATQPRNTEG